MTYAVSKETKIESNIRYNLDALKRHNKENKLRIIGGKDEKKVFISYSSCCHYIISFCSYKKK